MEKSCTTKLDTVYETQYEDRCEDVVEKSCQTVNERQCRNVEETVCDGGNDNLGPAPAASSVSDEYGAPQVHFLNNSLESTVQNHEFKFQGAPLNFGFQQGGSQVNLKVISLRLASTIHVLVLFSGRQRCRLLWRS